MSQFWNAKDKLPVRQTKVSIPAENGLTFNHGGLIHIHVPPTVKFFQPRESYLSLEVEIDAQPTAGLTRLQLDAELGGQVLIRDIRVYSGGAGGVLLEEIQNYNTLTAVKYDYECDDTIRSKRALTEGTTQYQNATRGTRLTFKSNLNNVTNNPYFQAYTLMMSQHTASPSDGLIRTDYNTVGAGNVTINAGQQRVKCLLPLNTGIFSSDRVFPALLTEGLRIELLLEDAPKCIKQLDTVNINRATRLGPIFHSIDGLEPADLDTGKWAHAGKTTKIYVKRDNNITGLENFPLVVGERIALARNNIDFDDDNKLMIAKVTGGTDNFMKIKEIKWAGGKSDAGATTVGGYWGLVEITLDEEKTMATAGSKDVSGKAGEWSIVSESVSGPLASNLDDNAVGWASPSYKVHNVELILQQLEIPAERVGKMMASMKEGGVINYDFLSFTNYKYSQLSSDVVANIRLPLSQTRAKSILSVPTDSQVYPAYQQITGGGGFAKGQFKADGHTTDGDGIVANSMSYITVPNDHKDERDRTQGYGDNTIASVRTGLTGCWDFMSQYQWFYNGQLNPSRPVQTNVISSKVSVQQQPLIELEKALAQANIQPRSFRAIHTNGVIGRALSLQNGTYNTVGRDFNLQVEYTGTAPVKNKLWHNYVSHMRRIVIKNTDIAIQI